MEKIKLSESDKEALRGVKKMIEEMCGCADKSVARGSDVQICEYANEKMSKWLSTNFEKQPTIVQLCKIAGLNQDKLKKGFKYLFSVTIYQYHLQLKMEAAKRLLRSTEETISHIAFQLGYQHSCSFCTAFKNYTGVSAFRFRLQPVACNHFL